MSQLDNLIWRRVRRCDTGSCIEVAFDGDTVWIRNSDRPDVCVKATREEWSIFREAMVVDGEFAE